MLRTCEHVRNVDFSPSFNVLSISDHAEVALDFFRHGILRLSSIIFNSPFECDVIQLNVRSGPQ